MKQASPLVLEGLTKWFGANRGIEDVSLELNPGEIFGFLGPNGAGKSTTIRLIMDFIKPTDGRVVLLGADSVEERTELHSKVGYLSGDLALYENMTGRALLHFLARLGKPIDWDYVEDLGSKFSASLDRPIKNLSKGNRQKLGIILAFMHKPELLILDEPTSGLDPLMKQVFYDIVRTAASDGTTLFISSHDLTEVQKICSRAGFIREGRLIAIEPIAGVLEMSTHRFAATFPKKLDLSAARKLSSVDRVEQLGEQYIFTVRGSVAEFVEFIARYKPLTLHESEMELEELFMHYYTDKETV